MINVKRNSNNFKIINNRVQITLPQWIFIKKR